MTKLKSISQVWKDGCSEGNCRKGFKPARVNCWAVVRDFKHQIIERVGFSSTLLLGQCLFVQTGRWKVSPLSSYSEQKQREHIQAHRSDCYGWVDIQTTPKPPDLLMVMIPPCLAAGKRREKQGISALRDGWNTCQWHCLSQSRDTWRELWCGTQCCLLGLSLH